MHLVLLPGMDGTEVMFGPLLRALPEGIRPVVVTYPGAGPNGYDDLLPRVVTAVEALPECLVLGWSFSGPLALRVANRCPERVRGVILAATFVRSPMRWLRPARCLVRTPLVGTMRFLRRLPIWLGRAPDDPLRLDKAILWRRVTARVLAARARAVAAVDVRDELRRCAQPVLCMVASDDRVVPAHNIAEIRRERPSVRIEMVGRGHFALYTHPTDAVDAIAGFASRCMKASASAGESTLSNATPA